MSGYGWDGELLGHEEVRARLPTFRAQSFLFTGPEGVGRRQVARWFAYGLNCQEGFPPCGRCASCRLEPHPDYLEIRPETETKTGRKARRAVIRLEQIVPRAEEDRESLVGWLETRPRFRAKIAVIDGAHHLGESAANALLKLLEEPPGYARLILIAPSRELVLPTLASRTLEVRFGPVDEATLSRFTQDPALLAYAEGAPGRLVAALADPGGLERMRAAVDRLLEALERPAEALEAALEVRAVAEGPFAPWAYWAWRLSEWPPAARAEALEVLAELQEALEAYVSEELAYAWAVLELRRIHAAMRRGTLE
ncbi:DNA polymerase III subunit [Marinithermus hydrothermalis]|uniref:DNA polymerase III, delta prime subunit n=1 Tax=Marinithermus hydrothermalis (strain DSM 14884 / JCM 11576 / T1) TaxID=869210 RepID=F2NNC2_MARHT|nr:DNA polymerase III subunit [Marinithermus hydrothermalis]AEB10963.1 DNA polymerase III, delta prime subunit [Marinithermus hydrothermalis DSM 14884]